MQGIGDWARLDRRDNALNAIRLALAAAVIISHSWQIPTGDMGPLPYLGKVAVDGFFAISGFLIAGSATRMRFAPFLWRRALRIMPGLWLCLLVTAFAIAPLAAVLRGVGMDWSSASTYVASNAALSVQQPDIGGMLATAHVHEWNSPTWTLAHEFRAYLIAGVLLVVVRWRRASSWLLLCASVAGLLALGVAGSSDFVAFRLLAFFAAGMVCRFESSRVNLTAPGAVACATALGAFWWTGSLPLYLLFGPLPLAYLVLWLGAALPLRVGSRNDLSYGVYIYGGPVQQLLVSAGLVAPVWMFAAASLALAVPLAAASWVLVERPAMRLRHLVPASQASGVIPATTVHDPSSSLTFSG